MKRDILPPIFRGFGPWLVGPADDRPAVRKHRGKPNCSTNVCVCGRGDWNLVLLFKSMTLQWPRDLPKSLITSKFVLCWEKECSTWAGGSLNIQTTVSGSYNGSPLLSGRIWLCALLCADQVHPGPSCAEMWQVENGIYMCSQHADYLDSIPALSWSFTLQFIEGEINYMHLKGGNIVL